MGYTTLFTDNFNRADNADLGADWTPRENTFQIVSNTAEPGSSSDCGEDNTSVTYPDNQYAQAALSVTGTGSGLGPGLRARSTGASDYYRVVADDTEVEVAKFTTGSGYTTLASISGAWTDGHVLRVEVEGTSIRVYDNGSQIDSGITDGDNTSGDCGVAYSGFTSLAIVDDYEGGSITAAAATSLATSDERRTRRATKLRM